MTEISDMIDWLCEAEKAHPGGFVGIEDGGLTLRVCGDGGTPTSCYLEIGGIPDGDE